jgi:glycosyltransferase involved in cell wall biosynthesis
LGKALWVRKFTKEHNVDIIHCNNPPYDHCPIIAGGKLSGIPVTLHFRVSRNVTVIEKLFLRFVDYCFSVSEKSHEVINKYSECEKPCCVFLGDGVCIDDYGVDDIERVQFRAELGLSAGDFVILLPATLQPGKGQDVCIDAAVKLKEMGLAVKWLFAGGEHYQFQGFEDELKNKIAQNNVGDHVYMLGHRSDVERLMAVSDAVIIPSRLTEGMPCVIMEAFAARKPVIASKVGGIPEAVDESVGVFVDPENSADIAGKVHALYGERKVMAQLSENARERAVLRYNIKDKTDTMVTAFLLLAN